MKVMSFNVEPLAEGADRLQRLDALAEKLAGLDADVLALHGIHGDGVHLNMGREMQRKLPDYPFLLVERAQRAPEGGHWRGVGFLSKLPIRRHGRLSADEGGHAVLWAQFEDEEQSFYVFNTEFAADPTSAQREVQRVVPFLNVCQAPGLLVATLNAETCGEAETYLTGHGWHNALPEDETAACGCDGDEHLWANEFFDGPVRAEHVLGDDAPTAGPGVLTTL